MTKIKVRRKKDKSEEYDKLSYRYDRLLLDYNQLEVKYSRLELNFEKEIQLKYEEYTKYIQFLESKIENQKIEINQLMEKLKPTKHDLFS
jgi:hypothetical protein